jgi:hypothetical protein
LSHNSAAKKVIEFLRDEEPGLFCDGNESEMTPLHLAVMNEHGVSLNLIKQLCPDSPGAAGEILSEDTLGQYSVIPHQTSQTAEAPSQVVVSGAASNADKLQWQHLIFNRRDTCLHKVIRLKHTECARYLTQRVKDDSAAKVVLGH